jgi:hypothetical protein
MRAPGLMASRATEPTTRGNISMTDHQFIVYTSDDPATGKENEGEAGRSVEERRRDQRYRVGVFAEIERGAEHASKTPGLTYNLSRSGALLLTMTPFELGEEVIVSFISSNNERENTQVRVIHEDRLFRSMVWSRQIGVEFVDRGPTFLESELSITR